MVNRSPAVFLKNKAMALAVVGCLCLAIFTVCQTHLVLRKTGSSMADVSKRTCKQNSSSCAQDSSADTEAGSIPGTSNQKCSQPSSYNCSTPGLPDLVFVAGIEGSGHHSLFSLFGSLKNAMGKNPFYIKDYFPQLNLLDPDADLLYMKQLGFAYIQKEILRLRSACLIDEMAKKKLQGGKGAAITANSYPMGMGSILSTARPDLLVLKYFHCQLYKLKIIVTKRHPIPALFSTMRRFSHKFKQLDEKAAQSKDKFVKDMPVEDLRFVMQARLFEDQLIYLNQQLQKLQKECSVPIHFFEMDNLFANSTKQSELNGLADFLELSKEERQSLWKTIIILHKPFPLPPSCSLCMNRTLYDFFEERKEMWPLLV